jgi:hypothetical protein
MAVPKEMIAGLRRLLPDATLVFYEPAEVRLCGRIATEKWYGPPTYDEGSAPEHVPFLYLDRDVTVVPDPDSEKNRGVFVDVSRIQMVPAPGVDLPSPSRRRVIVHGCLFQAQAVSHHSDVLIRVARTDVTPAEVPQLPPGHA